MQHCYQDRLEIFGQGLDSRGRWRPRRLFRASRWLDAAHYARIQAIKNEIVEMALLYGRKQWSYAKAICAKLNEDPGMSFRLELAFVNRWQSSCMDYRGVIYGPSCFNGDATHDQLCVPLPPGGAFVEKDFSFDLSVPFPTLSLTDEMKDRLGRLFEVNKRPLADGETWQNLMYYVDSEDERAALFSLFIAAKAHREMRCGSRIEFEDKELASLMMDRIMGDLKEHVDE